MSKRFTNEESKQCQLEADRRYYRKNAEKIKAKKREYRKANSDKIKKYREENAERIINYRKDPKNKAIHYAASRRWVVKNPEKILEIKRTYRKKNKEKLIVESKINNDRVANTKAFFRALAMTGAVIEKSCSD